MKKIASRYLAALSAAVVLLTGMTSCDDYLTVRPKSDYPDYMLFSNVGGFKDAIIGLYTQAREVNYYPGGAFFGGADLGSGSTALFEPLSCFWPISNSVNDRFTMLYFHQYESNSSIAGNIKIFYTNQYKIITNINLILQWIDDEQQNFLDDEMYSMIKGEALALRAYLMFDLIRAFGPPPTATGLHGSTFIAYPQTVSVDDYPSETYTQFMVYLQEDLDEAERLMKPYDPIQPHITIPDNHQHYGWLCNFRTNRMNYNSVLALQARVNLWMGDKTEALRYARLILDAKDETGAKRYVLTQGNDYGGEQAGLNNVLFYVPSNDLFATSEHIFGVAYAAKYEYTYYSSSTWRMDMFTGPYSSTKHYYAQHLEDVFGETYVASLYGTDPSMAGLLSNDARFNRTLSQNYVVNPSPRVNLWYKWPTKLSPLSSTDNTSQMPMIRLAEMYLIAAECETNLTEATRLINELREARWLKVTKTETGTYTPKGYVESMGEYENIPVFDNEDERMQRIYKEFVAEFQQEGQVFFMYKRIGFDKLPFASRKYDTTEDLGGDVVMSVENYILPKPIGEL